MLVWFFFISLTETQTLDWIWFSGLRTNRLGYWMLVWFFFISLTETQILDLDLVFGFANKPLRILDIGLVFLCPDIIQTRILDWIWFLGYEKELGFFRIGSGCFHFPFRYKDAKRMIADIAQNCPIFGMLYSLHSSPFLGNFSKFIRAFQLRIFTKFHP
jgi:hypothetical protein